MRIQNQELGIKINKYTPDSRMKLTLNRRNVCLCSGPNASQEHQSSVKFRYIKKKSFESKQYVRFRCFRRVFARDVERWD